MSTALSLVLFASAVVLGGIGAYRLAEWWFRLVFRIVHGREPW